MFPLWYRILFQKYSMRGFSCVFKFSREYLTTSSIRSELKPWVLARLDSGVCQYWTALYQIIQKFSLLNSRSLCLNYIYTHMNIFLLLVFGYVSFSRCFQVERVCRLCLNCFFFNLIWQVELRSLGFCTWVDQLKRAGAGADTLRGSLQLATAACFGLSALSGTCVVTG